MGISQYKYIYIPSQVSRLPLISTASRWLSESARKQVNQPANLESTSIVFTIDRSSADFPDLNTSVPTLK